MHRRPEIWILLLIVAAALVWVFGGFGGFGGDPENPSDPEQAFTSIDPVGPVDAETPVRLGKRTLIRDVGNARLEIEATILNAGATDLALRPPQLRLLTASGEEVPPFTLPFAQPPTLKPGEEESVVLRYWLEATHLNGALHLHLENQDPLPVKPPAPLDLNTLPDSEPVAL